MRVQESPDGRTRVFSVSPWEDRVGYARAVKAANMVFVAGTTSTDPDTGKILHPGDLAAQAEQAMGNVVAALAAAGAEACHVVRTTMYVTDMQGFEALVPIHKRYFGSHPPVATAVEVTRLAHPDLVFEIEATAVVDD